MVILRKLVMPLVEKMWEAFVEKAPGEARAMLEAVDPEFRIGSTPETNRFPAMPIRVATNLLNIELQQRLTAPCRSCWC